jgi:hypothetical protein
MLQPIVHHRHHARDSRRIEPLVALQHMGETREPLCTIGSLDNVTTLPCASPQGGFQKAQVFVHLVGQERADAGVFHGGVGSRHQGTPIPRRHAPARSVASRNQRHAFAAHEELPQEPLCDR